MSEENALYFELVIDTDEDDNYCVEVYDGPNEDDLVSRFEGTDFGNVLRHAIYDYDKVLAASAWHKDYFEWSEKHEMKED
jgi:hypothetical protein